MVSSQPTPGEDFTDGCDAATGGVLVESFTQPSRFDELIIGTQIPCTPGASQASFKPFIIILSELLFLYLARVYTLLSMLFVVLLIDPVSAAISSNDSVLHNSEQCQSLEKTSSCHEGSRIRCQN